MPLPGLPQAGTEHIVSSTGLFFQMLLGPACPEDTWMTPESCRRLPTFSFLRTRPPLSHISACKISISHDISHRSLRKSVLHRKAPVGAIMPFKVTSNYVPNVIKWKQTAVGPDFHSQRHTVTVTLVTAPAGKLSCTGFFLCTPCTHAQVDCG